MTAELQRAPLEKSGLKRRPKVPRECCNAMSLGGTKLWTPLNAQRRVKHHTEDLVNEVSFDLFIF